MKKLIYLFLIIAAASCAPHRVCDSKAKEDGKFAKMLYTSRYEGALHERDSLCAQSKQLMQDTAGLGKVLRNEKQKLAKEMKEHAELKKLYENLEKSSGAQLTQLNADLTKKQTELEEKQKKVDQLEGLLKEHQAMLDNLFSSIKRALVDFSPSELTVEMKNGKLYVSLLDKLLFESGKADVQARGVEALEKLSAVLNGHSSFEILVEGHTDNVPIKSAVYRDNWDLSTYRAASVVRLMIQNKVQVERLTAAGKGEFHPIASNDTPEGRSKNRRTEIILVPDLSAIMNLIK
ncbi:MAG: OmpA family protein [Bacteroidetes bacterium]|nr:OmpA family protein [Bacteroidota bacterium]